MTEHSQVKKIADRGRADARRSLVWLLAAAWTLATLLTQMRRFVDDSDSDLQHVLITEAIFLTLGILACLAIYVLLEKTIQSQFLVSAIAVPLMAVPAAGLQITLYFEIAGLLVTVDRQQTYQLYALLVFWSNFYLAWGAACLALLLSSRAKAERRLRAQAEASAHRARMLALRFQLNPHFLFNTLNSIAALATDGEREIAGEMLAGLSSFLRRGLTESPLDMVPLSKELQHQIDYLSIEKTRFSDRMKLVLSLPEELENTQVPGFILQPLVENAVKHGVTNATEPVTITIEVRERDGMLLIAVTENSVRRDTRLANNDGLGIGLSNVQQRLSEVYGEEAGVSSERTGDRDYRTVISIPMGTAATKDDGDWAREAATG